MSPAAYNYDETLSSLRYANRAKNIKNKPKINEDPKDAMLREYQEEISRLREKLLEKSAATPATTNSKLNREPKTRKSKKKSKELIVNATAEGLEEGLLDTHGSGTVQSSTDDKSDENDHADAEEEDALENKGTAPPRSLSGLDPETIARLQAEVESERRTLLAAKDIAASEKERIAQELESRAVELEQERQERQVLASTLKAMEAKLLIGGVNVVDHLNIQQKSLDEEQLKVQEKRRTQRELEQQVEAKQESRLQMEESYASLQEEVEVKTKKIKKLWTKLQAAKAEISDLHDEFRGEREDLLDTVRELSRELSLKTLLIEHFVPPDERLKIERRARYDEELDDWCLSPLTKLNLANKLKRPLATPTQTRRPLSYWAQGKIAAGDPNPRLRPENIFTVPLDMPESTTRPYVMAKGTVF